MISFVLQLCYVRVFVEQTLRVHDALEPHHISVVDVVYFQTYLFLQLVYLFLQLLLPLLLFFCVQLFYFCRSDVEQFLDCLRCNFYLRVLVL